MAQRTAPTVDGTPPLKLASFRWIDYTGDKRTDSYIIDNGATAAEIEALASNLVGNGQASLWSVVVQDVYEGVMNKANALTGNRGSLFSNIVLLFKDSTRRSDDLFIPAPKETNFIDGTDTPDQTELDGIIAAFLTLKAGSFGLVSGRYTERTEINKSEPMSS